VAEFFHTLCIVRNILLIGDGLHYKCKICNRTYKCGSDGVTSLKRHANTALHSKLASQVQSTNLFEACQQDAHLNKKARTLEMQIALFVVQKNLPFTVADELVDFLKTVEINPNIQKKLRCRRTKCTALICNVLGQYSMDNLKKLLQSQNFSIIIDETSDIAMHKHLAVCVRHLREGTMFDVDDGFLAIFDIRSFNFQHFLHLFSFSSLLYCTSSCLSVSGEGS
jgi:hypothetical protein